MNPVKALHEELTAARAEIAELKNRIVDLEEILFWQDEIIEGVRDALDGNSSA